MNDLVIRKGLVFDGTGTEGVVADVAVRGRSIVTVGRVSEPGKTEIDADGLAVAPGFIDIHSHSDVSLLWDGLGQSKLRQGVTTEIVGNCGLSPAPLVPGIREQAREAFQYIWADVPWTWYSVGEYLEAMETAAPAVNVAAQVGHSALRASLLGFEARSAAASDRKALCDLLRKSLDEGACGLSSGLIYAPSMYAEEEEFRALGEVLAERNKFYSTHMRGEGDTVLDSLDEALRVARQTGVRLEVSHLKAAGKSNWGRAGEVLEKVEAARQHGLDVAFDVYPYAAGSTHLSAVLPPWVHEGGTAALLSRLADPVLRPRLKEEQLAGYPGWTSFLGKGSWDPAAILIASVGSEQNQRLVGRTLQSIAEERGQDARDTMYDLLVEENNQVSCVARILSEDDVETILSHPAGSVGSDGLAMRPAGVYGRSKPHPRSYGTFPRVLGRYVRERRVLSLPEAIRKMTAQPAERVRLPRKGRVAPGYDADLVVFDPVAVRDTATFTDPHRFPLGIPWVVVNGAVAVRNGEVTGERNGRVLRC